MSLIAEFTIVSPFLYETERAVPSTTLHAEDFYLLDDGQQRYVFWASGGDFDALEAALEEDPTIAGFSILTDVRDRRLYRANLNERGKQALSYPAASKHDIVFLDLHSTDNVTRIRARVPSRESMKAYRDECLDRDVQFSLDRLYEEENGPSREQYGLTKRQFDTLVLAHEQGYYANERRCSMDTLAEELGISRQAVAGRVRRGLDRLIESTLIEPP